MHSYPFIICQTQKSRTPVWQTCLLSNTLKQSPIIASYHHHHYLILCVFNQNIFYFYLYTQVPNRSKIIKESHLVKILNRVPQGFCNYFKEVQSSHLNFSYCPQDHYPSSLYPRGYISKCLQMPGLDSKCIQQPGGVQADMDW